MKKQYTIQETEPNVYILTLYHNGYYQNNLMCRGKEVLGKKVTELLRDKYSRGYTEIEIGRTEQMIMELQEILKMQSANKILTKIGECKDE